MAEKASGIEVKQVSQIKVVLDHIPGSLAKVAEAIYKADVNIGRNIS